MGYKSARGLFRGMCIKWIKAVPVSLCTTSSSTCVKVCRGVDMWAWEQGGEHAPCVHGAGRVVLLFGCLISLG